MNVNQAATQYTVLKCTLQGKIKLHTEKNRGANPAEEKARNISSGEESLKERQAAILEQG